MTDSTTAATAATTARVTPTVAQPVRVDWGSWLSQFVAHEAPIIEATAAGGVQLALKAIPFGSFVSAFLAPNLIEQYVGMGLTALEGVISSDTLDVPATNTLFTTVSNLINTNEPALVGFVEGQIDPLIKAAILKLLPSATF